MVELLLCAGALGQVTPPKLMFRDGAFTVSGAHGSETVKLSRSQTEDVNLDRTKGRFSIKLNGRTLLFDSKGVTLTEGKRNVVNSLKAIPTSGKIATKESNHELMELVKAKKRKLEVSSLSGYEVVDKTVYLLARWEDSAKKPWLEAVVKVDTSVSPSKVELVTKVPVRTFAQGRVDDVLFARGDKLALLGNSEGSFGLARIALDGSEVDFEAFGDAVGKAKLAEDGTSVWTLTPTTYGTNILGIADLDLSSYHVVSEFRGKMTDVQFPSYARYKTGSKQRMVNLMTGAQTEIEPTSGLRATSHGLLVFSPAKNPTKAALLDSSFRRLAEWSGAATPVVAVVKPVPVPKKTTVVAKSVKKGSKVVAKKVGNKADTVVKKAESKATKVASNTKKPTKSKPGKKVIAKKSPELKIEVTSRPSSKSKKG